MPNINVKKLDKLIGDMVSKNQKPEKILIGYRAYSELMKDRKIL